jgi:hypothetical protein
MDVSKINATGWMAAIPFRDGLAGAYGDFLASLEAGEARL